ncbi:MAG TPA: NUDIX domain-containing protein, partial [Draconibacterium sp.]|nr:NUDIX domain-containing protein [Draconibacterium sp.]
MNFYSDFPKILVAVDAIIFGFNENEHELKLLLLKRQFAPEEGNWSLMGGFVDPKESLDHAAQRIVKKLTGLDRVYMEQLYSFGDVNRDAGGRIISVAYF